MIRVCCALLALFCSACGKDVPSPPALPRAVVTPTVVEQPSTAPVSAPSAKRAAAADPSPLRAEHAGHSSSVRPGTSAQAAPAQNQTPAVADGLSSVGRDGAQVLLLRAEGLGCTRMLCRRDNPCCNACMSSRWRPVQGAELLRRPDGKVLRLTGNELPNCSWESGQCGCAYDLRVVGGARDDQFIITEVVEVRPTGFDHDPQRSFSAAWFQAWVQAREGSLERCFTQRKRQNPGLTRGVLVVRIVLTPEGRVVDPKVSEDSVGDALLTDCITNTVRRWRASPAPTTVQSFDVHIPLGTDDGHPFLVAL